MGKLEGIVKELMETIDEEFVILNSFQGTQNQLINKQEDKIRETALTLLPLLEKIRTKGYYFRGKDTTYVSMRGPVLKHDSGENILYVFAVEEKRPVSINLYNDEVKHLTYRKLLEQVDFTTVMEGLLLVLTHHEQLKKEYQDSIDALESELTVFQEV